MKHLLALSLAIASGSAFAAGTTTNTITFDQIQTGSSYTEAGYLFTGNFDRDANFAGSPHIRFSGQNDLFVTRLDGQRFTVEGLTLLYQQVPAPPWFVENEVGTGFALERGGVLTIGQYVEAPMRDVLRLRIHDPQANSSNFYIFDNFIFSSPVPEPSAALMLALGLAVFALRRPSRSTLRTAMR